MYDDLDTDERPFVLIWELTQACELACKHCRAEADPARHPDELTPGSCAEEVPSERGYGSPGQRPGGPSGAAEQGGSAPREDGESGPNTPF